MTNASRRWPSPGSHSHGWNTAGTSLLLQILDRTVMAIMGWSNTAMAARYQHIIAAIRRDVATQVGGLLWEPTEERSQTTAPTMAEEHTAVAQQSHL
jgi:hypothetical protein